MTIPSPQAPRTTIVIGEALNSVLLTRRVPAPSQSARIDRLADRYLAIMADRSQRSGLTPSEMAAVFLACEDLNLASAKDAFVVPVRVKALAERIAELRWPCDPAALFHRLSSMTLTDLLRLVDLSERYRGNEINPEAVGVWMKSL